MRWGIFAGAAAKSALDTYGKLKDIEKQDAEEARKAEEWKWKKEQRDKEEDLGKRLSEMSAYEVGPQGQTFTSGEDWQREIPSLPADAAAIYQRAGQQDPKFGLSALRGFKQEGLTREGFDPSTMVAGAGRGGVGFGIGSQEAMRPRNLSDMQRETAYHLMNTQDPKRFVEGMAMLKGVADQKSAEYKQGIDAAVRSSGGDVTKFLETISQNDMFPVYGASHELTYRDGEVSGVTIKGMDAYGRPVTQTVPVVPYQRPFEAVVNYATAMSSADNLAASYQRNFENWKGYAEIERAKAQTRKADQETKESEEKVRLILPAQAKAYDASAAADRAAVGVRGAQVKGMNQEQEFAARGHALGIEINQLTRRLPVLQNQLEVAQEQGDMAMVANLKDQITKTQGAIYGMEAEQASMGRNFSSKATAPATGTGQVAKEKAAAKEGEAAARAKADAKKAFDRRASDAAKALEQDVARANRMTNPAQREQAIRRAEEKHGRALDQARRDTGYVESPGTALGRQPSALDGMLDLDANQLGLIRQAKGMEK